LIAEAVTDAPRIGGDIISQATHADSGKRETIGLLAIVRLRQFLDIRFDKRRSGDAIAEVVVVEQVGEHGGIGGDGPDFGFAQRFAERIERIVTRGTVSDRLGDHAVIRGGDRVALFHRAVEAERDAARGLVGEGGDVENFEMAGAGEEAACGIFRTQTRFDSVAGDGDLRLVGKLLAAGDAELQFNEIVASDHLRNGMLDLQARVHFHEPEPSGRSAPEPSTMNSIVPALR